jgi:hypothetical protein
VISRQWAAGLSSSILLVAACNSDVPVSAVMDVPFSGFHVSITRTATHPFLARFNLKLTVSTVNNCSATSELFPDTGGVSRRNLYLADSGRLYVVGQFDVRRFDAQKCLVELIEFRSLESNMIFVGSFDVDGSGQWTFVPASARAERAFEKL